MMKFTPEMTQYKSFAKAVRRRDGNFDVLDRLNVFHDTETPDNNQRMAITVYSMTLLKRHKERGSSHFVNPALEALTKIGCQQNKTVVSHVANMQRSLRANYDRTTDQPCLQRDFDQNASEIHGTFNRLGFAYPASFKPEYGCPSLYQKAQ